MSDLKSIRLEKKFVKEFSASKHDSQGTTQTVR